MHYPSMRYHVTGASRKVDNPDQEPNEEGWRDCPWPPPVKEPKLEKCCLALKAKFDQAYTDLQVRMVDLEAENLRLTSTYEPPEGADPEPKNKGGRPRKVKPEAE